MSDRPPVDEVEIEADVRLGELGRVRLTVSAPVDQLWRNNPENSVEFWAKHYLEFETDKVYEIHSIEGYDG